MPDEIPSEWSCPHGGRWMRWTGGWMQVVAPMMAFEDPGIAEPACKCEPPFPGQKNPVPAVKFVHDEDVDSDEDEGAPDDPSGDPEPLGPDGDEGGGYF